MHLQITQLRCRILATAPQLSDANGRIGDAFSLAAAAHARLIGVSAAEIRPICDSSHRFRPPVNLLSGLPRM